MGVGEIGEIDRVAVWEAFGSEWLVESGEWRIGRDWDLAICG